MAASDKNSDAAIRARFSGSAGYGIRWNIKYQSYQKAIDAREVINHILKQDQQQDRPQNQTGLFEDVHFLPWDWKEIDNLNAELEVFVKLTSQMEGNSATGTHVIPKYLELNESLAEKIKQSSETNSLYPMYHHYQKICFNCHQLTCSYFDFTSAVT
ncbi:hypothetical protein PCASD_04551 [Puccinia coronata f. sp. avenae]|uniref:Uncharacterized protein n=1 Tax=Puccinia coronata f. sp. avenae TaxID=200324 RepID=A0A2N5V559_9BASI|nr:hypothetical protein PCASD_04551 [Puccinia coronata f. sp. avenae]